MYQFFFDHFLDGLFRCSISVLSLSYASHASSLQPPVNQRLHTASRPPAAQPQSTDQDAMSNYCRGLKAEAPGFWPGWA